MGLAKVDCELISKKISSSVALTCYSYTFAKNNSAMIRLGLLITLLFSTLSFERVEVKALGSSENSQNVKTVIEFSNSSGDYFFGGRESSNLPTFNPHQRFTELGDLTLYPSFFRFSSGVDFFKQHVATTPQWFVKDILIFISVLRI
jgi:hypothetical protein